MIWKTPDQKPEENEDIVFIYGSSPITGCYKKNDDVYVEHIGGETFCDNEVERWAYVEDIIAQADKAERLQKAVDLALFRLENILMDEEIKIRKRCPLATSYLEYDIERIKQLIKE